LIFIFTIFNMRKVLVLGAYGNFGKYIINTLLQDKIPLILAGRKPQ